MQQPREVRVADPHHESEEPDAPPPVLRFTAAARSPAPLPSAPENDAQLDLRLGEIETRIEKLAERFDQLEFVIVEQFEPGMTPAGDMPHGNLRERLDRIEAALGLLSLAGEERPPLAAPEASAPADDRLEALADRLSEAAAGQADRVEAMECRIEGLAQAVDALAAGGRSRHDDLLAAMDRLSLRPMPAPDLTIQHRSFAGFATALQVTLGRLDDAVESIMAGFGAMTARLDALEALEARGATAEAPTEAPAAVQTSLPDGLAGAFGALGERIAALTDVLAAAAERRGPQEIATLSAQLEALGAVLSAGLEDAVHGNRAAMEETLRDLRLAVAEIAAENQRLRIA